PHPCGESGAGFRGSSVCREQQDERRDVRYRTVCRVEDSAEMEAHGVLQLLANEHTQERKQLGSDSGPSERRESAPSVLFAIFFGPAEAFRAGPDASLCG